MIKRIIPSKLKNSLVLSLSAVLVGATFVGVASAESMPSNIHRSDYLLQTSTGVVHVEETYSDEAMKANHPRRGVLLIPGPVVNAAWYDMSVEGYDAGKILADKGYFAFAVDLPGVGQSTGPADGRTTTTDYDLPVMREVIDQLSHREKIPKLDVYGEGGTGGVLALKLSADKSRVRTIASSAQLYKNPTPLTLAQAMNPGLIALFDQIAAPTNYYLQTVAPQYGQFVANASAEVQAYTSATQPGLYPLGSQYELIDGPLPLADPTIGKVPALFMWGAQDFVAEPGDIQQLAQDYGKNHHVYSQYTEIANGGHLMRIEAASGNGPTSPFWNTYLTFLAAN